MGSRDLSQDGLKKLHDALAKQVDDGTVVGLAGVVARGDTVHFETIGNKTAGSEFPVERDSIFRISSMTKPITGVAAMILVEDGRLRLDDPIDELLPELKNAKVLKKLDGPVGETEPLKRPITMRDLLTFRLGTGGLFVENPDDYPILEASAKAELSAGPPAPAFPPEPDEWIRRFATLPLMFQPGEKWMYHTSASVLGILIRRAAGSFEGLLNERLFGPLRMKDTGFHVPENKLDRFTTCYMPNFETGAREMYDAANGQWSKPPKFAGGGDGLVSTVDDYLAFARMLLGYGTYDGERILSRASVELMTTNHITPDQRLENDMILPDDLGWGFCTAVVIRRDDVVSVGGYGWDGGMGSSWRNDPREDLIGIVMATDTFSSPRQPSYVRDFWTHAYAAIDD